MATSPESAAPSDWSDFQQETQEWLDALDSIHVRHGSQGVRDILAALRNHAMRRNQANWDATLNTPYRNTIPPDEEPRYPGDIELETRIENIIRWNAMAMVVRANKHEDGIGGHISTYASCATLFEVGLNHFFRGKDDGPGDQIFF